jgi:hypothetical protein
MKMTLASLAAAGLGAALLATPAAALPVPAAPAVDTNVQQVQFFENLERAGERGLKAMARNSDQRRPSGLGTTRHPNRPDSQDIYAGEVSGGERARNRR